MVCFWLAVVCFWLGQVWFWRDPLYKQMDNCYYQFSQILKKAMPKRKVTHTWNIDGFPLYKLVHTECGNWGIWKHGYTDDNGRVYKGFALKFTKSKSGYTCKIRDDFGRQRVILLHTVIMNALLPSYNGKCVKFLDGNKYNLRLSNMVWTEGPNQKAVYRELAIR